MVRMITFHQKDREKNGVTPYDILLDKEYTVKEFIDAILADRIYDKGVFYILGEEIVLLEYAYGHTRRGFAIPNRIECLSIKYVTAKAQWSQIDYYIRTGDDNGTEKETR